MSALSMRTLPARGGQILSSSLHRVDLPAALGPMIARDCPAGIRNEMFLMIWRSPAAKYSPSTVSSPTGSGSSMGGGSAGRLSSASRRLYASRASSDCL